MVLLLNFHLLISVYLRESVGRLGLSLIKLMYMSAVILLFLFTKLGNDLWHFKVIYANRFENVSLIGLLIY